MGVESTYHPACRSSMSGGDGTDTVSVYPGFPAHCPAEDCNWSLDKRLSYLFRRGDARGAKNVQLLECTALWQERVLGSVS